MHMQMTLSANPIIFVTAHIVQLIDICISVYIIVRMDDVIFGEGSCQKGCSRSNGLLLNLATEKRSQCVTLKLSSYLGEWYKQSTINMLSTKF